MASTSAAHSTEVIRQRIGEDFLRVGRVGEYLKRNTTAVDRFVRETAYSCGLEELPLAVAAVGGYGRSEMFPYSDIDILVLVGDYSDKLKVAVEAFITNLWELGLTVGSAVRTSDEMIAACKEDISVATAFMEARFLLGQRSLFDET